VKILFVHTRHYASGGDSTYSFGLSSLLKKAGHHVSFFAMRAAGNLPDPNTDLFVSHIDFKALNQKKSLSNGLKVLTRSVYSREARAQFGRLLHRLQPDLIHIQSLHGHITPSVLFEAENRDIPVVWTLHDYKLLCPNTHFLIDGTGEICEACSGGKFFQAALKRCKKNSRAASTVASIEAYVHQWLKIRDRVRFFISPSKFLRSKFIENNFPAEQVIHLPNMLPESFSMQRHPERTFEGQAENYFLFYGRITNIKGIDTLLQAARIKPGIRFKLVGAADQAYKPVLQSLPSNVEYSSPKTGRSLKREIMNARAVIVPSIWYENQPYSILEAFSQGKPVIASDLGGMPELVEDHKRGLLFAPGDADALATSISVLHHSPDQAKSYGQAAQEYVFNEHGPEVHYRRIMNIYGDILNASTNTM